MIVLQSLSKHYRRNTLIIKALDRVDLSIPKNEFVVVRGPSGSGKTTLLLSVGGMLHPTSGGIKVDNQDIYALDKKKLTRFRARKIGFVFQLFHLIPYLTVLENALLPTVTDSSEKQRYGGEAMRLLRLLNLEDRASHYPAELSAGEKQRTAIARAMIKKPDLILADEPTGNLDPQNAVEIAKCLAEIHRDGCTIIVVSHGHDCDLYADRIILLDKGRIISDKKSNRDHTGG